MNRDKFIPGNLKAARQLLGLSQLELAELSGMQQKDISLHETKETKTLIPVRYILFLYERGIDLNSLMEESGARLRPTLSVAAEPPGTYEKATAPQRKLGKATSTKDQLLSKLLTPEKIEALLRLAEKEEKKTRGSHE